MTFQDRIDEKTRNIWVAIHPTEDRELYRQAQCYIMRRYMSMTYRHIGKMVYGHRQVQERSYAGISALAIERFEKFLKSKDARAIKFLRYLETL